MELSTVSPLSLLFPTTTTTTNNAAMFQNALNNKDNTNNNITSHISNSRGNITSLITPEFDLSVTDDFNLSWSNFSSAFPYSDVSTKAFHFKGKRRRFRPRRPRIAHQDFLDTMDSIVMPIAFAIGIIGSAILIPVFTCTPLKASALAHYLTAIGVVDLLYLLATLPVWISKRGYRFNNVIGVCQLTMFTLRLSRFLGTWYLLAAHVERCLVHFGSRRSRVWCSTFRTKCLILVFFIFSLVGFVHYIWTHVVDDEYGKVSCMLMRESVKHILKLYKIELVASIFLPMALIIPIDGVLIVSLLLKRYRSSSFSSSSSSSSSSSASRSCFRLMHGGGGKNNNNSGSRRSSNGTGSLRDPPDGGMDGYVLARRHNSRTPSFRSGDSTPPPPEFDLSREQSRATLVVVVSGLLFVGFLLPSAINRAMFIFGKSLRMTPHDLFTVTFIEKMENFYHVFKCILYILMLRSFRNGLLYLRKCRRKGNVCQDTLQETEV